jgi:hypothetical protein
MYLLLGLQLLALEQVSLAVEICLPATGSGSSIAGSAQGSCQQKTSCLCSPFWRQLLPPCLDCLEGIMKNPAKFNSSLASRPIKPGVNVSCTRYVWQLQGDMEDWLLTVDWECYSSAFGQKIAQGQTMALTWEIPYKRFACYAVSVFKDFIHFSY